MKKNLKEVADKSSNNNTQDEKKKIVYLCRNLLNRLYPLSGHKPSKRVGRGKGSGKGKTAGRGDKGQYARNQAPALRLIIKNLIRKLPKRGMAPKPINTLSINMENLKHLVEKNSLKVVNNSVIFQLLNTPKKYTKVKIIHNLNVDNIPAINLEVNGISSAAKTFIESNKGKVNLI